MTSRYASARRAKAVCDVCGFVYKLRELRTMFNMARDTHIKACRQCWDPDHPQQQFGQVVIDDPQSVRDPRPDFAGYAQSRAVILPVYSVVCSAKLGYVTVTTV